MSQQQRGALKTITVVAPAAGADWTQTVTAGKIWKILGIKGLFAASAAAANRYPNSFGFKDAAGNLISYAGDSSGAITAGQSYDIIAARGFSKATLGGITDGAAAVYLGPLGDVLVPGGGTIFSDTNGIQAADQWSSIFIQVEEFG